jgi:predicted AlkP superfamily pyrophosphatase or phosphodiesterase
MLISLRRLALAFMALMISVGCFGSAYDGRPKLIVVIVIDQFRGDYLERWRTKFASGGFRLLMEQGAWFSECYYDYANLHTAPGHATLGTGAYTNGHGILGNDWYDPSRKGVYSSVKDTDVRVVGIPTGDGASPRNLLATTLGDELKLATGGRSRVFGLALKDRSAILTVGHTADGAYWIDKETGVWITSSYYRKDGTLPVWVKTFNAARHNEKYWGREFRDASGKLLSSTIRGTPPDFYEMIGQTPFANEYTLEFARELITAEKLGQHQTTDLLFISLSGYDILGHKVGPDSPAQEAETIALDRQLAQFFTFLNGRFPLGKMWVALSADHGISPQPEAAKSIGAPATRFDTANLKDELNAGFRKRFPSADPKTEFIKTVRWTHVFLDSKAFSDQGMSEVEAEGLVGEAVSSHYHAQRKAAGLPLTPAFLMRGFYTKAQLEAGLANAAADATARKFVHSYSPFGGWYVIMAPPPFLIQSSNPRYDTDTDHGVPYSYDAHVPLIFYGPPFKPGIYRTSSEPVDLATTLASLLGLNRPSHAVGRVLTEALK